MTDGHADHRAQRHAHHIDELLGNVLLLQFVTTHDSKYDDIVLMLLSFRMVLYLPDCTKTVLKRMTTYINAIKASNTNL